MLNKKVIETEEAPAAIGPYSQGILANSLVFTSGQLPVNPDGIMPGTVEEQTRQSLKNIEAVLKKSGCSMDDIIKTTVFLNDMNDFSSMNSVYEKFFSKGLYPARSAIEVGRLPKDALVEIEAVALKQK